jgi:DNA-binding transcriptional LysR family regulator
MEAVMLDAVRLRVLVEVAHAGSIAAAAARMSFTPSALSQQLAKLEREVGCRLVDRGPAGVRLTKAGQVLVGHGEAVLGELRAADDAVRSVLGAEPDSLAIGTFATAGKALVPQALGAFRRNHPSVRLSLLDLEPPGGHGLITSRELDVLITHRYPGGTLPSAGGLHRHRLLIDPLLLVLPADHPAAASGSPRLADLSGEEWISGGRDVPSRVCLRSLGVAVGVEPHVAFETADYEVTMALVTAGLGIALVPASVLCGADRARMAVRRLAGVRPAREVFVVHRKRPSMPVATVVTLLGEVAAKLAEDADVLCQRSGADD